MEALRLAAAVLPVGPGTIGCDSTSFQRERRIYADVNSTDIYLCVDDDCLLASPEPFIEKAVDVLRRHADFGILSVWPSNSELHPWTPGPEELARNCVGGRVYEDDEVMEHVSVGGIRICRPGLLKDWPLMTGRTYDSQHCAALRAAGYRSGYIKPHIALMNHLGRNYSQVWP